MGKSRIGFALPALSFLLGTTEILATAAQDAFFLAYNPERRIPVAIVGGSVGAGLASLGLAVLMRRLSARAVAVGLAIFLGVTLCGFAAWTRHGTALNTLAQYVFLEMSLLILSAAAWAFVQGRLDPPTARKILPLAYLYWMFGVLAGGLLVPLWLHFGSITGLLVGAAIGWLVCAWLLRLVQVGSADAEEPEEAGSGGAVQVLFGSRLSRRLVLLSFLLIAIGLVVEFHFKSRLQARYDEEGIAVFEGLLLGVAALLAVPLSLGVVPRFLARIGVHRALTLLPALVSIGLIAFIGAGHLAVIAGVMLIDRTLKPTIQETGEGCLIGALNPRIRGRFSLLLDGAVIPTGAVACGLIFVQLVGTSWVSAATWGVPVLAAVYIAFALRIKPLYVQALTNLLPRSRFESRRRRPPPGGLGTLDGAALELLLRAVDEGSEAAAALAEEVLQENPSPQVQAAMERRLTHSLPRVREIALRWFDRVGELPKEIPSPDDSGLSEAERALRLSLSLRNGSANARLERWASSSDPSDRRAAAEAAGRARVSGPLAALIRDPDPSVRSVAMTWGSSTRDPAILEATLDAMDGEGFSVEAVVSWGPAAVSSIRKRMGRWKDPMRAIRALGEIRDGEGVRLLRELASQPLLADAAVSALVRLRSRWPEGVPPAPDGAIREEVQAGRSLQKVRAALALPLRSLLLRELDSQIAVQQERVARRLQLLGSPQEVWAAFESIRTPESPDREVALELLGFLIPPGDLRAETLSFFEGKVDGDKIPAKEWLARQVDPWIRSAARNDLGLEYEGEDPMKGMLERILFLRDVPLFQGLDNRDLTALAEVVQEVAFDRDGRICAAGEVGKELFLVQDGVVSVRVNDKEVAQLGRGECLGEMSVLERGPRTADVYALTPTRLWRLPADLFRGLLESRPGMMWGLIRVLLERLKATSTGAAHLGLSGF